MNLESIETELTKQALEVLAPPPDLTISEWADQERKLTGNAEPGAWRTDRAPYQRGIMDSTNEPGVNDVVIMSSSQVGKTEFLLNIIGYYIDFDPCPILVVMPSLEVADSFSKDRLAAMLRDTPALFGKVQDPRARDSGNTTRHKIFPGGHITIAGANSPASLASRPIRLVLCDEVDRYPISAGTEGDPVKLAQKRATTFFNKIFITCSTPTVDGNSRIQQEFEESDQRYYHVPCPSCKQSQVLKFEQLKWDTDSAGLAVNARYKCKLCDSEFDDSKKSWMLKNGSWVASAVFKGKVGFHISELYSPWVTWQTLANDFLVAKKSTETLKVFINTGLGETWKERGEAPDWKRLYDIRESYEINKVPKGGLFLTCGVDVQADRLEAEIVAWGRDKQSWSIDYRVIVGNTSTEAPWLELDKLLYEGWQHESGATMQIRIMAVDSGFNTQHVYNWVRKHQQSRVMAVKGNESASVIVDSSKLIDVTIGGKKIKRGVRLWTVGVNIAKSELYGWLRQEKPLDGGGYPHGYCHFPQYGEEFFKQLTAEQIVVRTIKGRKKFEWTKTRDRNESLDTRVYARAAAAAVGLDRFKSSQWDFLENELSTNFISLEEKSKINKAAENKPKPKKKESTFW